jgi:hypothetical protein
MPSDDKHKRVPHGYEGRPATVSVSLQTVPDGPEDSDEDTASDPVAAAKLEATEIVAAARREAEAIVAEARADSGAAPSPLAALGDNAEEIIAQVHKLITKQRTMEGEKQGYLDEIAELRRERDELVQRLTDAVVRMEELAAAADAAQAAADAARAQATATPAASPAPAAPAPPAPSGELSLAQRLAQAEREERAAADSAYEDAVDAAAPPAPPSYPMSADGRSFYSRHSAKLPRLEGDGGRSVLSAVGDMRPEPEQKGRRRKTRRRD